VIHLASRFPHGSRGRGVFGANCHQALKATPVTTPDELANLLDEVNAAFARLRKLVEQNGGIDNAPRVEVEAVSDELQAKLAELRAFFKSHGEI
jgi:adenylosuccinate lyase